MPRAKRGNKRLERRKKILKLAKGYRGTKSKLYRSAKESVERGLEFRLHRPKTEEARFSKSVDRSHRRRRTVERPELFAVHARFETGRQRT